MSDDTPAAPPADQAGAVRGTDRPATFRDVFAVSEYRAVYLALLVNWLGDYLARAAITVLVYQQTQSVLLSAASFAISYLPWIVGGPLLAALAERYAYRRVMIVCDLLRMVMVGLVAIPGLPVGVVLALAFLGMLTSPPTQAAQVIGYMVGATVAAAASPRLAIAGVALTFGLSALILATGVRSRPPARSPAQRSHLLHETAEGFQLVFGNRLLRPIAVLVFTLTMFAIVPEGLAAGWAAEVNPDPSSRGFDQGLIMAAGPVGWIIGGLMISRLVSPAVRQRLIRPLAIVAPLALVPALAAPPVEIVALLTMISGIAQGGLMPTLNGLFVLALPHGYRARAFGVMQGGLQISQGGAVLVTGLLAQESSVPITVGLWSVGGVLLMIAMAARWPSAARFERAIAEAAAATPEQAEQTQPVTTTARPRVPAASATRVTPDNR